MFRKEPHLSPLTLRKELLIAESEINRAQLVEEWQAIADGTHRFADGMKMASSLASIAGALMTGVSTFRRGKIESTDRKASWFQTVLKGAQVAGSIWLAFRSRPR
jgi:hypothetical protein